MKLNSISSEKTKKLLLGGLIGFVFIGSAFAQTNENETQPEVPGGQGQIERLYRWFLAGTNNDGFITFQREIVFPVIPIHTQSNFKTNRVQQAKGYVSFCWSGSNFIAAYSLSKQLTNEEGFTSADRLYGYDGKDYWRLLENAFKTYIDSRRDVGLLPPQDVASYLTIIPEMEVLKSQNKYITNPTFATIVEFASECRRVAQLGFSYPMQGPPVIINSNYFLIESKGRSYATRFAGSAEHPENLIYEASTNRMPEFHVFLDYKTDTITIDRISQIHKTKIATIRYKILLVRKPIIPSANGLFSWQTYKAAVGNVVADMAKNGGTVSIDFTKGGQPQANKVLTRGKPLPGKGRSAVYFYLTFAIITLIPVIILFLHKKQTKNNKTYE